MNDATIERLRRFDPFAGTGAGASGAAAAPGEGLPYLLLDVFTDTPLQGNPLAVFTDGRGVGADTMQRIARELNLSESVFMLEPEDGGDVRIRIFTPVREMPFAGHPTLGSAVVAGAALGLAQVTLETGAGPVAVGLDVESSVENSGEPAPAGAGGPGVGPAGDPVPGAGRVARGTMAQPLPTVEPFAGVPELLAALGLARARLPVELYRNGPCHVCVALGDEDEVAALSPDLGALGRLGELCVSCFAGAGRSWTTRMFAPALGVAEDPATGSAAGPLALHLARHGDTRWGDEIAIHQGAAVGRPSLLRATVHGRPGRVQRIEVTGDAVFVARAEMRL